MTRIPQRIEAMIEQLLSTERLVTGSRFAYVALRDELRKAMRPLSGRDAHALAIAEAVVADGDRFTQRSARLRGQLQLLEIDGMALAQTMDAFEEGAFEPVYTAEERQERHRERNMQEFIDTGDVAALKAKEAV